VDPITCRVEISRRPEEVFAYISDVSRFPEWQENVVSASVEGNMRRGARLTMIRLVGRRRLTFVTEVTDYDPPHSQGFRGISGPVRPAGTVTIEPLDNGARCRLTFKLEVQGAGLGKLLVPLVRRQARQEVPIAHERLKELLEQER
jgi:uncharacterized membrane protein